MIPIHLLNIAWQSLLLSACAWLIVALLLRDARRRAWMAAMGMFVTVLAPLLMLALPAPRTEPLLSLSPEPASEWKPDWTVKVQPIPTRPVKAQRMIAQPLWSWSDLVLPAERVWMSVMLLLGLWNGVRTLNAWRWRRQLHPGPRPRVHSFEGAGSPCVVGLLHPRIAVPKTQNFNEEQWQWLLAHEGEHVRGGDTAIAWLFEWARAWLWWNPFMHTLINAWSQAREEVCDAAAVQSMEEGERYANFLIEVAAAHQASGALAMAASRPARRMKARLLAVLDGRRVCERVGWRFATLATCAIGGALVIVGCSGLRADDPVMSKTFHRFVIPVEPGEFAARVKEVQAQGYTLMDGSSDEVAVLKNTQGAITEVRKDLHANEMMTRVYKVAPDFLSADVPPKGANGVAPRRSAMQVLEARGIKFPEGCSAVYNPVTSQLIVKHTAATLRRLEQVINDLQVILPMAYLQTKIIEGQELFGEAGHIYDDAQFQMLIRGISQKKGVDLISAPSVTTKLGQRATVEAGKEVFNDARTESKFVGLRVELDPNAGPNGVLKLKGKLEIGDYFGEMVRVSPDVLEFQPPRTFGSVKQWDKPFDMELRHGQTTVLHLGETRQGRFVTMFITAKAIQPSGEEARQFDENCSAPVQSVQVTDASSFTDMDEKKMQREMKEAKERKQVYLTAKVVDLSADEKANTFEAIFNVLNLAKATAPQKDSKGIPILPEQVAGQFQNGDFALSGILTDPQFQVVIRALSQKKGVDLLVLPSVAVKSGQLATLSAATQTLNVEPVIGPDGYTIDLSINYEDTANEAANPQRKVTTAVTTWDGQTLVLGGTSTKKDGAHKPHSRLVFVTSKIIDPSGNLKSKAKQ